jgi:hypothetical protein
MKKNHFYISYFGNKRTEAKYLYDLLDLTNITTIIEPFCGSCAISYYIWTLNPGKFKYVFNDNDKNLKLMYDIIIDDIKAEEFNININELIRNIKNKDDYLNIIRKKDNLYSWFIKHKVYRIRTGLYNPDYKYNDVNINILKYPISEFYRKEKDNITFTDIDANEVYIKYKDDINNVLILDPPYLTSNNLFYNHPSLDIFNYLFKNHINDESSYIYLIIESTFIMNKIFDNYNKYTYAKGYQTNNKYNESKRKTEHMILYNKK